MFFWNSQSWLAAMASEASSGFATLSFSILSDMRKFQALTRKRASSEASCPKTGVVTAGINRNRRSAIIGIVVHLPATILLPLRLTINKTRFPTWPQHWQRMW